MFLWHGSQIRSKLDHTKYGGNGSINAAAAVAAQRKVVLFYLRIGYIAHFHLIAQQQLLLLFQLLLLLVLQLLLLLLQLLLGRLLGLLLDLL